MVSLLLDTKIRRSFLLCHICPKFQNTYYFYHEQHLSINPIKKLSSGQEGVVRGAQTQNQ